MVTKRALLTMGTQGEAGHLLCSETQRGPRGNRGLQGALLAPQEHYGVKVETGRQPFKPPKAPATGSCHYGRLACPGPQQRAQLLAGSGR